MEPDKKTRVYIGEALARYSLGEHHPFGPARHDYFVAEFLRRGLDRRVAVCQPVQASQQQIELFHTHEYVETVKRMSREGAGYLDAGDTPAFPGMYEAAATVCGTTLAAIDAVMDGNCQRAFVPIAGLHHGRRDGAAGFCVFNDCGVAIEYLKSSRRVRRILYVDIDAHHGDGVYYSFADDPDVSIVDFHEDGRYLYPGTGTDDETGIGTATGTKRNVPMPVGAADAEFFTRWKQLLPFMRAAKPEFVLLQCGADSLAGDPITHMQYTAGVHGQVAADLRVLASEFASGRIVAMGGGGYNLDNLAQAWCAVVEGLVGEAD